MPPDTDPPPAGGAGGTDNPPAPSPGAAPSPVPSTDPPPSPAPAPTPAGGEGGAPDSGSKGSLLDPGGAPDPGPAPAGGGGEDPGKKEAPWYSGLPEEVLASMGPGHGGPGEIHIDTALGQPIKLQWGRATEGPESANL